MLQQPMKVNTLISAICLVLLSACGDNNSSGPGSGATNANPTVKRAAVNVPPVAVITAPFFSTANQGIKTLDIGFNQEVILSGQQSTDRNADRLNFRWELIAKPEGSKAKLVSGDSSVKFTADYSGHYIIRLTVLDGNGGISSKEVTLSTPANEPPVARITRYNVDQEITALTINLNESTTLSAQYSNDRNGDKLSYKWTLLSKPASSTAKPVGTTLVSFKPDAKGSYTLQLTVSDGKGGVSRKEVVLSTLNHLPVGAIKTNFSVFANTLATISTQQFYDEDKDPISINWTLDNKPQGSTTSISIDEDKNLSFMADKVGVYTLTVQINDGRDTTTQTFNIDALTRTPSGNSLKIPEGALTYSRLMDRLILLSEYSSALYIINPYNLKTAVIQLPIGLSDGASNLMRISENGRYVYLPYATPYVRSDMAVNQKLVSILDLSNKQIIKNIKLKVSPGSSTAAISDDGLLYVWENRHLPDYWEGDEGHGRKVTHILESIDITKNMDSFINNYGDDWEGFGGGGRVLSIDNRRNKLNIIQDIGSTYSDEVFIYYNPIDLDSNHFPPVNSVLKNAGINYGPEEPVCSRSLALSSNKLRLYTSDKSYFRLSTSRIVKEGELPLNTNTASECISNISESPVNSNELAILQDNNTYTILRDMQVYETGNLPAPPFANELYRGNIFYANNGNIVFSVNTANGRFVTLK